jgi:beta-barrel assembly-enhancing protease
MASAGFDPMAMPSFFWTMQQRTGGAGANIPPLLRTHPVTTERIAETRDRADQLGRRSGEDSLGYGLVRERLHVQMLPPESDFRGMYADAASVDLPSTDARRYGRALALMAAGAPAEAIPVLADLRDRHPDVTLYHAALGQAQLAAGDVDESRRTLAEASGCSRATSRSRCASPRR